MLHQRKICCLSVAIWRGQVRAVIVNEWITGVSFLLDAQGGWCNVTALVRRSCTRVTSTASALRKVLTIQLCISAGLGQLSSWHTVTALSGSCCRFSSDTVSLCPPWCGGFSWSEGNWSRENQLRCKEWRLGEESGGGGLWWHFPACSVILKHRCSLHAALSAFEHTPPPSSELQSVCPSDPPLNPDYYGFVFFQPVICIDDRAAKGYLVRV